MGNRRNKKLKKQWELREGEKLFKHEQEEKKRKIKQKLRKKYGSIWTYNDFDVDLTLESFSQETCIFCDTKMQYFGKKEWEPDNYCVGPDLRDPLIIQHVYSCNTCGWWKSAQKMIGQTPDFMISDGGISPTKGLIGNLLKLDMSDINNPVEEIKSYLLAKYDERFNVHPRKFEEVVASVFKNIGYDSKATGYTNDGGIDVILSKEEELIGVQVKRYKNSIEVEQIRSLAGALLLKGLYRGVFVTTSTYQSGAQKAADIYNIRGYPIELIDAPKFYDMLKISQNSVFESLEEWFDVFGEIEMIDIGYSQGYGY